MSDYNYLIDTYAKYKNTLFVMKNMVLDYSQQKIVTQEYTKNIEKYMKCNVVYIENLILELDNLSKLSLKEKTERKECIVNMQKSLFNYDIFISSLKSKTVQLLSHEVACLLSN